MGKRNCWVYLVGMKDVRGKGRVISCHRVATPAAAETLAWEKRADVVRDDRWPFAAAFFIESSHGWPLAAVIVHGECMILGALREQRELQN